MLPDAYKYVIFLYQISSQTPEYKPTNRSLTKNQNNSTAYLMKHDSCTFILYIPSDNDHDRKQCNFSFYQARVTDVTVYDGYVMMYKIFIFSIARCSMLPHSFSVAYTHRFRSYRYSQISFH